MCESTRVRCPRSPQACTSECALPSSALPSATNPAPPSLGHLAGSPRPRAALIGLPRRRAALSQSFVPAPPSPGRLALMLPLLGLLVLAPSSRCPRWVALLGRLALVPLSLGCLVLAPSSLGLLVLVPPSLGRLAGSPRRHCLFDHLALCSTTGHAEDNLLTVVLTPPAGDGRPREGEATQRGQREDEAAQRGPRGDGTTEGRPLEDDTIEGGPLYDGTTEGGLRRTIQPSKDDAGAGQPSKGYTGMGRPREGRAGQDDPARAA
ncbi:hypothetical protein BDW22DRAFT_1433744 [Trametopsis cervina]|nr:hypothetical protein BDW22DRAFT_1433744 [Trametopsis cervina]